MDERNLPSPNAPVQTVVSVTDLVIMLQTAANGRGKVKHRLLMMNAAYAIQQLVQRLAFHETEREPA